MSRFTLSKPRSDFERKMRKTLPILIAVWALFWGGGTLAHCQNPFTAKKTTKQISEAPGPGNTFMLKLSRWQQQLKRKMADLIRQARTEKRSGPLVTVLLMAFVYGVLHAAGPGHGKAVATSFMISRNPTLRGGLAFGVLTALFHGLSGIFCVLVLRYVIQQSVSSGLGAATNIMQVVSFTVIGLLGLGILIKNLHAIVKEREPAEGQRDNPKKPARKSFLPWALAVGLVPCPGVVMVLLFCMSMDAFALGLLMALCISLGMAITISAVILAVVLGKGYTMRFFSAGGTIRLERFMGVFSGIAVTTLAVLFLIA